MLNLHVRRLQERLEAGQVGLGTHVVEVAARTVRRRGLVELLAARPSLVAAGLSIWAMLSISWLATVTFSRPNFFVSSAADRF